MNRVLARHLVTIALGLLWIPPSMATTIDADRMVAKQQQKQARFDGHVELVTDGLHLASDHLTAYYRDHLGGQIERAEASGHVRIQHKGSTGRADRATLDQGRDLLILSGNAELTEQGRLIRGGRIAHHLKGGDTTVTEGKQGERVHIHIDDDRNTAPHE